MTKRYRLILLSLALIILLAVSFFVTGGFAFVFNDFWFTAGFLLLITLSLVDQPHFSKDSNIFINCITAGLSLLLVPITKRDPVFWAFTAIVLYLLFSSYVLMFLRNRALGDESKTIQFLSRVNRFLGRPEVIFSAFFIWGAVKQFGADSGQFSALFWYWVIFMAFNTPYAAIQIENIFDRNSYTSSENAIAEIVAAKSKNYFLARLIINKPLEPPVFLEFTTKSDAVRRSGYVTKISVLHDASWVHIYSPNEGFSFCKTTNSLSSPGIAYLAETDSPDHFLDRFVGFVASGTSVSQLIFAYEGIVDVGVGRLLETNIRNERVIYQVTDARITNDSLESKDEDKATIGEAMQLGVWNQTQGRFDLCDWVPSASEAVYKTTHLDSIPPLSHDEIIIGSVPDSGYPVIMDKATAVTHHLAILGVTGTGKSHFARHLIRELASEELKVIVVDLTGEYKDFFPDLKQVISGEDSSVAFRAIETLAKERGKFLNQQNPELIERTEKELKARFYSSIRQFLAGSEIKGVFEIPDISNKSNIFEYVRWFFWVLFETAKTQGSFGKRVCVVLEEAHTVVPEYGSMGTSDNASKASVNSIAQIALQGRKYNIGLVVIAQRTANVSKTILTQCNSIIAFQEFDKTSTDFLSNYMSPAYLKTLSGLKFRTGIAVGKAFKSTVPMVFEVPYEDDSQCKTTSSDIQEEN